MLMLPAVPFSPGESSEVPPDVALWERAIRRWAVLRRLDNAILFGIESAMLGAKIAANARHLAVYFEASHDLGTMAFLIGPEAKVLVRFSCTGSKVSSPRCSQPAARRPMRDGTTAPLMRLYRSILGNGFG
jgi:hypothetical protein